MKPHLRRAVFERDGWRCQHCGTTGTASRPLSIDHIHPRSRGGGDAPSNLQTLCRSCNSRKTGTDRLAPQLPIRRSVPPQEDATLVRLDIPRAVYWKWFQRVTEDECEMEQWYFDAIRTLLDLPPQMVLDDPW